jgi:O-antigen/teichoic acid export membrane protein
VAGDVAPVALALLMVLPLAVAGVGGGSVVTPNQALSFAEVDASGGSTAGGMLQTAQRVGNAIGAAVISAGFYAVASGAPASGPSREQHYGHAYATGLAISVTFALAALALAVRGARHPRPIVEAVAPGPPPPKEWHVDGR